MPKPSVDVLVYVTESFDTDSLLNEMLETIPRPVIVLTNDHRTWFLHKPDDVVYRDPPIRVWRKGNQVWFYRLYPLFFVVGQALEFLFFFRFGMKYRVKSVVVKSAYSAVGVGLLRRLGLFERFVFFAGDYFGGTKTYSGIWTWFNSGFLHPVCDYLACKMSDLILNQGQMVGDARKAFWKRSIAKNELTFVHRLKMKRVVAPGGSPGRSILFLGSARHDSGLDVAIKGLRRLRERMDVGMRFVGKPGPVVTEMQKLAAELGLGDCVTFHGFVSRAEMPAIFADCFCGIELLTEPGGQDSTGIPAKLLDYLQYGMPAVLTRNSGSTADLLTEHKLALCIEPNEDEYVEAVCCLRREYNEYYRRIVEYIVSVDATNVKNVFCG